MEDLLQDLYASSVMAGKIDQTGISVPISLAAAGEPGYTDIYSETEAAGFHIDNAYIQGVSMPNIERGVATGGAANIPDLINQISLEEDMDPDFIRAVMGQESGGNPKAVSDKGAMGLMQLMPATAKGLGVTDPYDPEQNIRGGVRYLKQQRDRFGTLELALAAYNAGPNAVSDYLYGKNETGKNPSKRKTPDGIPPYKETQDYVKNIMSKYGQMQKNSYPIDHSFRNHPELINSDTGLLDQRKFNDLLYVIQNGSGYKGNVKKILTDRPELLENKPEYADFKKYRDMKADDGSPLFAKADYPGIRVMVKRQSSVKGIHPSAVDGLAADMVATQSTKLPNVDSGMATALVKAFSDRYSSEGGLANLSRQEYRDYGVPDLLQGNAVLQARVLAQEFQRAVDLLGSESKAVYALGGGQMKTDSGEVKTWAEIKADKEAFMKNWFIRPSENKRKRDELNALLAMYHDEVRRTRGY